MLVTVRTRFALDPINITSGIENHVVLFGRVTDSDPGKVLSTTLACSGSNRGGKLLGLDLSLERLKVGLPDPIDGEQKFGVEPVDSGGVAVEAGTDKGLVSGVMGFVERTARMKRNRERRSVEEKGLGFFSLRKRFQRLRIEGKNMLSLLKRGRDIENCGGFGGRDARKG